MCVFSITLIGQNERRINENMISAHCWGIQLDSSVIIRNTHTCAIRPYGYNYNLNTISDTNGNLLFYVRDNLVYNYDGSIALKGDSLCLDRFGGTLQSTPSLFKMNDSLYILVQYGQPAFFNGVSYDTVNGYPNVKKLYYSYIEWKSNLNKAKIISKNNMLNSIDNILYEDGYKSFDSRFNPITQNFELYFIAQPDSSLRRIIISNTNVYLDTNYHISMNRYYNSGVFSEDGRLFCTYKSCCFKSFFDIYSIDWNGDIFQIASFDQNVINPNRNSWLNGYFSQSNKYFYFLHSYQTPQEISQIMRIDIQSPSTIDTLHTTYLSPSSVNDFLVRIFQGPYDELYSMTWGDPTRIGRIPYPDDSVFVFEPNHFSYNPPIGGSHPVSTLSSMLPLDKIEFPDFIYSNGCQHQPMNFSLDYSKVIDSLHWNFGESGTSTIDRRTSNPSYTYTQAGTYSVRMICFFKNFVDTITHQINILPAPSAKLPPDSFLCPNDSLLLNVSQGFPATYLWSTGSIDSSLYVSQPGTYWVTVTTDSCGSASDTIVLSTYTPPAISLQDTVACEEDIIVFSVLADRASYRWNTGDTTSSIYAEAQGIYSVTATNPCGESTAEARLERQPCDCKLYIPDAFTPNADGNNDVFTLVSNCNDMQWEMVIYNRWGQQVALLNEQQPQWNGLINGQTAPDGLYSYTLRYHFPESQPIGHSFRKVHYGQLLLLR